MGPRKPKDGAQTPGAKASVTSPLGQPGVPEGPDPREVREKTLSSLQDCDDGVANRNLATRCPGVTPPRMPGGP